MKSRGQQIIHVMKTIYLTKFKKCFPTREEENNFSFLLEKHLKNFSDKIIQQALDEMPNRFTWIPDISEMTKLCQSFVSSGTVQWSKQIKSYDDGKRHPHEWLEEKMNLTCEIMERILKLYPELQNEKKSWVPGKSKIFSCIVKIKEAGKKYFPDLDEVEVLKKIKTFSDDDYRDVLEDEQK